MPHTKFLTHEQEVELNRLREIAAKAWRNLQFSKSDVSEARYILDKAQRAVEENMLAYNKASEELQVFEDSLG